MMKIIISEPALAQLQQIFEYYEIKVSKKVAKKIKTKLLNRIKDLRDNPRLGMIEENLTMTDEVRYLVQDDYKILYLVEEEFIKIIDFFDSRQNPDNMKV